MKERGTVLRMTKEGIEEVKAEFERLRKLYDDDWGKVNEGLKLLYSSWDKDDPRKSLARFTRAVSYTHLFYAVLLDLQHQGWRCVYTSCQFAVEHIKAFGVASKQFHLRNQVGRIGLLLALLLNKPIQELDVYKRQVRNPHSFLIDGKKSKGRSSAYFLSLPLFCRPVQ